MRIKQEELDKLNPKPPKKKKFVAKSESEPRSTTNALTNDNDEDINDEEKKEESSKLKKYFKNRYVSFLKTLKEENNKKKEDEEKARLKEERIKNKMIQKLGIGNVQSRFRSEMAQTAKTSDEDTHIKRSASMAKAKKDTRGKLNNTTYGHNLGTPKNSIRNRLNEVKELDEKVNEDKKTRVEANERIRKKQADYLKSLADKKKHLQKVENQNR